VFCFHQAQKLLIKEGKVIIAIFNTEEFVKLTDKFKNRIGKLQKLPKFLQFQLRFRI